MKDFCILGSGIAGSTMAKLLSKKYSVQVFDKAKGVGGRSSNRRYKKNLSFDHGAQYISTNSKEFNSFINKLYKKKILKKWEGTHLDYSLKKKDIKTKYIGKAGNNDISKYLLKKIEVKKQTTVKKLEFNKTYWNIITDKNMKFKFKNIIVTFPYPQAKNLLKKYLKKSFKNLNVEMKPNITLMLAFKNYKFLPISSIRFNDQNLEWAANENSKGRFKSNLNLWTLQASKKFSAKYINTYKSKKKEVSKLLINKFLNLSGLDKKKIIFNNIHGWKYSFNYKKSNVQSIWSKKLRLGVCGDWFIGPKIENAWQSSENLFKKII